MTRYGTLIVLFLPPRARQSRRRNEMSTEMAPVPKDSPLMKAWETYKASDDYANSRKWARHASDDYVDGSLWAAFAEGFRAAAPSADQRAAPQKRDSGNVSDTPAAAAPPDVGRLLETGECYCGGKNGGHYYSCDKFDKPGYVDALEKGNEKLQARIAELEAQNVGWGTVPREPTEAIRRAFKTAEELPWPKDGDAIRQDWQHYLDAAMREKEGK